MERGGLVAKTGSSSLSAARWIEDLVRDYRLFLSRRPWSFQTGRYPVALLVTIERH